MPLCTCWVQTMGYAGCTWEGIVGYMRVSPYYPGGIYRVVYTRVPSYHRGYPSYHRGYPSYHRGYTRLYTTRGYTRLYNTRGYTWAINHRGYTWAINHRGYPSCVPPVGIPAVYHPWVSLPVPPWVSLPVPPWVSRLGNTRGYPG